MKFIFNEIAEIPKLSWCAVLEKGKDKVHVYHGPWVETQDSFFVEGIWDTPFSEARFDQSCLLMGSGGRVEDQKLIFACPCHTLERLYYIHKDSKCYVSNSIAFILVKADLSPDINYLHYVSDFESISKGIDDYVKKVPLEKGHWLNLAYYQNLVIESDLSVRRMEKSAPPQVSDFASYRQFLVDSLRLLSNNAKDPGRRIGYSPLATISRGYDSTACAALAAEVDCSKVLTVAGPGKYINDCGTDIAKIFGYRDIVEVQFDQYKSGDEKMIEPFFMASGELGTDCFWASYEEHLPKTFVLIGINGGKIWDINHKSITPSIKRSVYALATSLSEYRLKIGFVQVPIPFFGCVNHLAIHQITISEEMRPWVLGNDYDRPIPRRIVEEKGVPRNQFGVKKVGIGFNMHWDPLYNIKQKMARHSYISFLDFYKTHRKKRKFSIQGAIQSIKFSLFFAHMCLNILLSRIGFKSFRIPRFFPFSFGESPFACSYLFLWGIHHTKKEYQIK